MSKITLIDGKKFTGVLEIISEYKTRTECKNGLIHGKYIEWWYNGNVRLERHYKDGEKHGDETKWDEDGNKISETFYVDGW